MDRLHRLFVDPSSGQSIVYGTGLPDAALNVPQGSLYVRRDAVTDAGLYIKLASGWQALAGGAAGVLSGSFTAGRVPVASGTTSLTDSPVSIVSGNMQTVSGNIRAGGSAAGFMAFDRSTGTTNAWELYVTSDVLRFYPWSQSVDRATLTASGVFTAASFVGNGANLTNLSYSNLTGVPAFARTDTANTFSTGTQTFTGAVIGNGGVQSDTFKRANGNAMLAYQATSYTVLYDPAARAALYLGGTGDPRNYYDNTNHRWRAADGSTVQMELATAGLSVVGTLSAGNLLTVTRNGTAETTQAILTNNQSGSTALHVTSTGVTGTSGVVRLYATGDSAKRLELVTGNDVQAQFLPNRTLIRFYNGNGRLALQGDSDGNQGIWYSNDESTWFMGRTGGDAMRFFRSGADVATISVSGVASANFTLSSDRRLKTQLTPMVGALNRLMLLTGYQYHHLRHQRLEVGLLAQDLQLVLPEAVIPQDDGYLGVAYDRVIPLLVEAVKELRAEVQRLSCPR